MEMESATRGPFALSDDAQPSSPQRLHSGVMPVIRPAQTLSESLVATLVDVTGLVIYFTVAATLLRGTLL